MRLHRGDFAEETVYGDDPVEQALAFQEAGARWVHVVDLDAALTGSPANREAVAAVAAALDVPVQAGGGVRGAADAAQLFGAGVARVVMGTAAVEDPRLVESVAGLGPVAVGLDVRGREVAVRGWTAGSGLTLREALALFDPASVDAFVVTQVERDGTQDGPDLVLLREALGATGVDVVASGGVGSLEDLQSLAALECGQRSLAGAIVGVALYEGTVALEAALEALA